MKSNRTRRDFLRTVGWGATALALPFAAAAPAKKRRPNVLVIMNDDLGYSDLGCFGSEINTPNLDSLARRGVRFSQFYGYTVCCPSRACVMTGLYPHQAGMGWFVNNDIDLRPPGPYEGYLNDRCVTTAEVLRGAGYRTLMSGKWHLGESPPHWPTARGFDRYFGLISGQANYFDPTRDGYPGIVRRMAEGDRPYHPPPTGFYMTDAIADHAVEFLEDERDGAAPFFMHLAFTAPHCPLHAPAAAIARYRGRYRGGWDALRKARFERQKALGLIDPATALSPRDPAVPAWADAEEPDREDLKMAIYAAQIDVMDRGVGRVLAKLREIGQEDNTAIFFLSDHGACRAEEIGVREEKFNQRPYLGGPASFAAYGTAWANASNTPWRKYKGTLGEGGISIPMIAVWPASVAEPGGFCHEIGHQIDLLPTILEMTGVDYPRRFQGRDIQPLEGASLVPWLRGAKQEREQPVFWEFTGRRAMRHGAWKIVADPGAPWELYDLSRDRAELQNLAQKESARVREMSSQHAAWADRCGVKPWREIVPLVKDVFR